MEIPLLDISGLLELLIEIMVILWIAFIVIFKDTIWELIERFGVFAFFIIIILIIVWIIVGIPLVLYSLFVFIVFVIYWLFQGRPKKKSKQDRK